MDWKFTNENPLRVVTLFSGYDSQCIALRNIGVPFDLVAWSEIDKYAIQAHNAIFPEYTDRNLGDVAKIEWGWVSDFDLMTYSFPCTDISNAGQQQGLAEGSGTRSSLLWECKKCVVAKHPKYLLMENVKNLVSDKFLPYFKQWLDFLTKEGYTNYAQVLNAKDYGVPQNRERIFVVSILGNEWYNFPKPFPLEKRLIDILEPDVDEKYYISDEKVLEFLCQLPEEVRQKYGIQIPADVLEKYRKENPATESYTSLPLGMCGCQSHSLKECVKCKFHNATEQCERIYRLADMEGINLLMEGNPYVTGDSDEETVEDWMMEAGWYDED